MPNSSHGGASHHVDIGHDVWIGHGAIVLPGRNVGTGAVGRGRRDRDQGRSGLHHRRRKSGADRSGGGFRKISPTGSRSLPGGTGTMRRCAAPCPISASSTVEDFLDKIRGRRGLGRTQSDNKVPHRDRHFHRRRPGPARPVNSVETSLRIAGREIARRRRGRRPRLARHRCQRSPGAAGHRRSAWRRLRAADDAASRRRFSGRCGAGRQRPAGDRQRHHHRLSRHDLVVGAGPAQRRQCQAVARSDRDRCGRSLRRTPASICATRPTTSRPRPRIIKWLSRRTHRPVRVQRPHGFDGRRASPSRKSAAAWSSAPAFPSEAFDNWSSASLSRAHDVPGSIARLAQAARDGRRPHAVA